MNNYVKLSIILPILASNLISIGILNSQPINRSQLVQWKGIDLSKVSISDIKYRMTEGQILRKLGNPVRRESKINCLGSIDRLHYPGLVIDLEQQGNQKYAIWIDATDPHYGTDRGVKVGDSIAKALKSYDPVANLSIDRTVTVRDRQYGDLFLVFKSNDRQQISMISIVFEC